MKLPFNSAEARALRNPPPPGDPSHGKVGTYKNYRCRCDLCRAAESAYQRALPSRRPKSLFEGGYAPTLVRIANSVIFEANGCWTWARWKNPGGYGAIRVARKDRGAHRVAYELLVGPIPDGLQLDHLCRNRACVNPDHLEPVTCSENVRRAWQARKAAVG